jgi:vesicle coat complex subunit
MFVELLLTPLLIGNIESHSTFDIHSNTEFILNTRTIISNNKRENNLIQRLQHPNPLIRIEAINQISEENPESAFEFLLVSLEDPDFRVRGIAAMNIGKTGNPDAAPYLIQLLKDSNHSVRGSAALSLGRLESKNSIKELIKALKDTHYTVKLAATYSLGMLKAKEAVTPLTKLLNDDNAEVRENAAWVLGLLKEKEAIPHLELLVQDPDEKVRLSAKKAIFFIKYSMISDTSDVHYSGGNGQSVDNAVKITGIKNSFACLKSQKQFINSYYGDEKSWEQLDQKHVKYNNKHYDLIIVKEANSGNIRNFYFDISELFKEF